MMDDSPQTAPPLEIPSVPQAADPDATQVVFRLRYSRAQQVFLVGPFNNWSTTATPMHRMADDRWEASVHLQPGCYAYCYFVIDEAWFGETQGPPHSPTAVLNSGSVIHVPSGQRIIAGESLN
ncbi:MAG: glycoside hydrolase family 13 domain protein [Phycisphaerales bacterium]|jgi:1,4-alpha-glucan branching enzyme|nr:glycoside hydrolase family 13 domain protein [Phycisphaerales bacterium]MDB5354930.1 glycoside hydrolase family 13 domain protein [Phycisphaerales bacterium]